MKINYKKIKRLAQIIAYNRDWQKYITTELFSPPSDKLLTFRLRSGLMLSLRADTRFLLNEIYLDKVYDIAEIDYSACHSVLDLGGNVGLYSLYVASVNPNAKIFSFEPSSENLLLYRKNLQSNPRQAAQIQVFPVAVGAINGTVTLAMDRTPAEYSIVEKASDTARTEQVECIDLERAFDLMQIKEIDFAKIDIEGAEMDLLFSMTDDQLRRIKTFVVEWHYSIEKLHELVKRFQSAGFDAKPVILEGHMRFLHAFRKD